MFARQEQGFSLLHELIKRTRWLICAVFATVFGASFVHGDEPLWRAPLSVRNAEPLNTLFLQAHPASASVLAEGHTRIQLNLDIINHLLFDRSVGSRFEQDFEIQRLTVMYAQGVGDDVQLAVFLPLLARNGGILDEIINIWHRWFGLKGGGRANYRNYQIHERLIRNGQTLVSLNSSAIGTGDAMIEVSKSFGQSGRSLWAVRAMVKLPTGNAAQQFGSGAMDAGLGVVMTYYSSNRLAWHANLSKVWVGQPVHLDLPARDMVQWMVAIEYLLDSRTSLIAQIDDNHAPVVVGVPYSDGARRSLSVGLAWDVRPGMQAQLSLTENQFGWLARVAPDFHLHFGLHWSR